jgi:C4-dicarboxylate transporter, DctM subunit
MSSQTIGIIGLIIVLVLMFCRVWVGAVLSVVGLIGFALVRGWPMALTMVGMEPYTQLATYTFAVLPLFTLMGVIISNTGMGEGLFDAASKWLGRIKGGLAIATVVACGVFAAVCGSSAAEAVTMGKLAYPELKRHKYADSLSAGVFAAGGTIGILIPPSMNMCIFGMITETSIGQLFIAGIIPGVLQCVLYIITIQIIVRIWPSLAPNVSNSRFAMKEKVGSLKGVWQIVFLIVFVIGGLYGGFFTPTEAAAIGCVGAFAIAMVLRKMSKKVFMESIVDTCRNGAMIAFTMAGAYIFTRFLTMSRLPAELSVLVADMQVSKWVVLAIVIVFYLIAGCFLDITSCLILTVPIIFPTIIGLGFNPIWFGILCVKLAEMGMISPPYGLNCFVVSSAINVPTGTVFKGVIPFILSDVVHLSLIIAFPVITTILL